MLGGSVLAVLADVEVDNGVEEVDVAAGSMQEASERATHCVTLGSKTLIPGHVFHD